MFRETSIFLYLSYEIHKMSPNETLFLESTNAIHKENVSNSSFVHFAVWDFPGKSDDRWPYSSISAKCGMMTTTNIIGGISVSMCREVVDGGGGGQGDFAPSYYAT